MIGVDLAPSLTAKLDASQVIGFAIDIGGKTSHSAIIARSLGIPAVVGLKEISFSIQTGDFIIIDGYRGTVIVNPSLEVVEAYRSMKHDEDTRLARFEKYRELPTVTADGILVQLAINIAHPKDTMAVKRLGLKGSDCIGRSFCSWIGRRCQVRRSSIMLIKLR